MLVLLRYLDLSKVMSNQSEKKRRKIHHPKGMGPSCLVRHRGIQVLVISSSSSGRSDGAISSYGLGQKTISSSSFTTQCYHSNSI